MTTRQSNLIIPGAIRFDTTITINIDTVAGQTELKITRGKMAQVQVLAVLMEHATTLLRNMAQTRTIMPGSLMRETPTDENTNGGTNGAA